MSLCLRRIKEARVVAEVVQAGFVVCPPLKNWVNIGEEESCGASKVEGRQRKDGSKSKEKSLTK